MYVIYHIAVIYKSNEKSIYLLNKIEKDMTEYRINIKSMIVFVLTVLFLHSCAGYDWGETEIGEINRTVLIYMVADNNLSRFADYDIAEIRKGDVPSLFGKGTTGDVLLLYLHKLNETPKLIRFSKDRFGVVNEEIVKEYGEQNSLDKDVMMEVLSYVANIFPSKEHGLVLWSHATGWLPQGYYANPKQSDITQSSDPEWVDRYSHLVKSFGSSETYGRYEMDLKELASALPLKYSFIIFDACFMGGVEVAYELKDKCDYMIFSPAEVLARGMPYDMVLGSLFTPGVEALKRVSEDFFKVNAADGAATVSMIETRMLNDLAEVCFDIFQTSGKAYLGLDMEELQGYFRGNRHWFYDLDDFMSRIANETLYRTFDEVMRRLVVCKYATEDYRVGYDVIHITNYSGLSTYVPNPENDYLAEYYKTLAWNKAVRMVE